MSNYAWKSRKFALKWCPFQQWIPAIYYAGEIWKRCFDSENASTVFRRHYAGKKLKTQQLPLVFDLRLRKLGQEIMIIIVTLTYITKIKETSLISDLKSALNANVGSENLFLY